MRLFGRPLAHLACSLPLLILVLKLASVGGLKLGPNPQLVIRDLLGEWGLRLLLVTLCMTPLRWIIGKPWPGQFRRLLGLWSFAYLSLHFITYFFWTGLWTGPLFWRTFSSDLTSRWDFWAFFSWCLSP